MAWPRTLVAAHVVVLRVLVLTAVPALSAGVESQASSCSSEDASDARQRVLLQVQKENKAQRHKQASITDDFSELAIQSIPVLKPDVAAYGNSDCRCVGLDKVTGEISINAAGSQIAFPGDLGAHCEAWDDKRHPSCSDSDEGADWCKQPWCFVDPCRCSIPTLPKISSYMPNASFRGRTVYYSYATCGGTDTWTANNSEFACQNIKTQEKCLAASTKCLWAKGRCGGKDLMGNCTEEDNSTLFGTKGCRCVGVLGRGGSLDLSINGESITYPGDTGSSCAAWDNASHPDCSANSSSKPDWCGKQWCYVDPCSCGMDVPPKIATYTDGAMFQGRKLYYSYSTCGATDSWTSGNNAAACVNQKTEGDCSAMAKCRWTEYSGCLGTELAAVCDLSATPTDTDVVAPPKAKEPKKLEADASKDKSASSPEAPAPASASENNKEKSHSPIVRPFATVAIFLAAFFALSI